MGIPAKEALKEFWEQTTFGTFVRDMRKCDEMTQAELAEKMGVSKQFVSAIESGRKAPTLNQATKIAHALGYDEELFVEKALEHQIREAHLEHLKIVVRKAS